MQISAYASKFLSPVVPFTLCARTIEKFEVNKDLDCVYVLLLESCIVFFYVMYYNSNKSTLVIQIFLLLVLQLILTD